MRTVVYDPAKVRILKPIHNNFPSIVKRLIVVYDPAKVRILKPIHNVVAKFLYVVYVVYDPAKVRILKPIHNVARNGCRSPLLFMTLQR